MIKHKWKLGDRSSDFCVKCGLHRGLGEKIRHTQSCTMSDATWKQGYKHSFKHETYYRCVKCGILYSSVLVYYFPGELEDGEWVFKAYNRVRWVEEEEERGYRRRRRMYRPSIKIPCTMSHEESVVKDIIE